MTDNTLTEFLQAKQIVNTWNGFEIDANKISKFLKPFQRDITRLAVAKGRFAIFADAGLGKTYMQLEWAHLIGVNTLIIAPLSVARQTVAMSADIGIEVQYVRHQSEVNSRIVITNYEMIDNFDPKQFDAVVLDESSILKSFDSSTRRKLVDMFSETPFRLACTATPSPNDQSEIGNHSEFLGVASLNDMLSMFFVHANRVDYIEVGNGEQVARKRSGSQGQEWRLKNHARESFYEWMASWSISIRKPADLGYDDAGYDLPKLTISPHFVEVGYKPKDQLFFTGLHGVSDRSKVRKATIEVRLKKALEILNEHPTKQWIIWCGLQDEADMLEDAINQSKCQVKGQDAPEFKAQAFEDFQDKKYKVLITKPRIAGFGMNFQQANKMMFFGLNDSYEQFYQCVRREWRYGQKNKVDVHIILSEAEREIWDNVKSKEKMNTKMQDELIKRVKIYEEKELRMKSKQKQNFEYKEKMVTGKTFTALLGDSCELMKQMEDNSIHLSVYSPPFADLYTYSATVRDLGNSKNWDEFFEHYKFIIRDLLRVTVAGRLTCVHTADIPAMQVKDGYIGMKDFPGAVIKAYEDEGWIFVGRAIVAKNPQAQAIRTKAKALLFATLKRDSSDSRPAILDQILIFKKPGDNPIPILPIENGEMNHETWIDWAGGIWLGIQESDTLQYTTARDANDEKHICPLQLGTIERCIKLYSNPGEVVFSPFGGIGSEAYQAIRFGRRAVTIELKESYFKVLVKNLKKAEDERARFDLFQYKDVES